MEANMVLDGHLGGYIHGGDPGTWCPALWNWVVKELKIRSVLDVGCGEGHSTKFFRDLGCDVLGVDGCQQAIDDSVIPDAVVKHDFCDGPLKLDRRFDLVWSCEFVEHVEQQYVENILRTFALADKAVLMTHAFPGQDDGHHHVNCQPTEYWIEHLERHGYACHIGLTVGGREATLRDYAPCLNHFARSGLLFANPATVPGAGSILSAASKARWISSALRFSTGYWAHRFSRRAAKRRLRQAA